MSAVTTQVTAHAITPADATYTFGYYDRCPWSPDQRYHLALRLPHQHGLPQGDEAATLCAVELATGAIEPITDTLAWNHQQGAMSHWLSQEPDCVVVNDRVGDRVFSKVVNRSRTVVRELPRPVYALNPQGTLAASLDFARIQRRGYSYAVSNPKQSGPAELRDDDGLWVMDLATGASRLVASYAAIAAIHPDPDDLPGTFCWLNHAIWNSDGSRLMVLFRYRVGDAGGWKTYLYTVKPDGSDLRCPLDHARWSSGGITHQMWGRTPDELLVDADYRGRGGEFTVCNDRIPTQYRVLAPGSIAHGHQMFSPDGRWLVTDSYPRDGIQELKLARVSDGHEIQLPGMRHGALPGNGNDWRCDLHPRWRPDGKAISIDSIDDGQRRIYVIELEGLLE
ncbi:MAG: hypothetical protein PF961_13240 [Planctomycetota bacterium]|nr:hypothetical protein [Planctomycetota bacterium]